MTLLTCRDRMLNEAWVWNSDAHSVEQLRTLCDSSPRGAYIAHNEQTVLISELSQLFQTSQQFEARHIPYLFQTVKMLNFGREESTSIPLWQVLRLSAVFRQTFFQREDHNVCIPIVPFLGPVRELLRPNPCTDTHSREFPQALNSLKIPISEVMDSLRVAATYLSSDWKQADVQKWFSQIAHIISSRVKNEGAELSDFTCLYPALQAIWTEWATLPPTSELQPHRAWLIELSIETHYFDTPQHWRFLEQASLDALTAATSRTDNAGRALNIICQAWDSDHVDKRHASGDVFLIVALRRYQSQRCSDSAWSAIRDKVAQASGLQPDCLDRLRTYMVQPRFAPDRPVSALELTMLSAAFRQTVQSAETPPSEYFLDGHNVSREYLCDFIEGNLEQIHQDPELLSLAEVSLGVPEQAHCHQTLLQHRITTQLPFDLHTPSNAYLLRKWNRLLALADDNSSHVLHSIFCDWVRNQVRSLTTVPERCILWMLGQWNGAQYPVPEGLRSHLYQYALHVQSVELRRQLFELLKINGHPLAGLRLQLLNIQAHRSSPVNQRDSDLESLCQAMGSINLEAPELETEDPNLRIDALTARFTLDTFSGRLF